MRPFVNGCIEMTHIPLVLTPSPKTMTGCPRDLPRAIVSARGSVAEGKPWLRLAMRAPTKPHGLTMNPLLSALSPTSGKIAKMGE